MSVQIPLREITRSALRALVDQGLNVTTMGASAYATAWDAQSHTYRIAIRTASYIEPHHLRNMELALGARCESAHLEWNHLGWAEIIVIEWS